MAQMRLNLNGVTTLLVDSDHFTRGIIAHMLRGFGMESPTTFSACRDAKEYLKNHMVDLILVEAVLPDMDGAGLIRWIRRRDKNPLRFVPIIVLSGYTQLGKVSGARDSGANIVVKKPVSPQVLYDHIAWVGRVPRPFIEAGDYSGPDRRFKTLGPPRGVERRIVVEGEEDEGDGTQSGLAAANQAVA
jgi:CheY-like chemotaxis protein